NHFRIVRTMADDARVIQKDFPLSRQSDRNLLSLDARHPILPAPEGKQAVGWVESSRPTTQPGKRYFDEPQQANRRADSLTAARQAKLSPPQVQHPTRLT